MNLDFKSSDDELIEYSKILIIFSLTERLRSILQNQRFKREFHYGLGILKMELKSTKFYAVPHDDPYAVRIRAVQN